MKKQKQELNVDKRAKETELNERGEQISVDSEERNKKRMTELQARIA